MLYQHHSRDPGQISSIDSAMAQHTAYRANSDWWCECGRHNGKKTAFCGSCGQGWDGFTSTYGGSSGSNQWHSQNWGWPAGPPAQPPKKEKEKQKPKPSRSPHRPRKPKGGKQPAPPPPPLVPTEIRNHRGGQLLRNGILQQWFNLQSHPRQRST